TVPECGHPDRARQGRHLRSHPRQRSGDLPERGIPRFRDSRAGARYRDHSHDARVAQPAWRRAGGGRPPRNADGDRPRATPADGLADIDRFTRFLRATKAPARDTVLAATPAARRGSELFDAIGCATCHVRTLVTAAAGTAINGGTDTIPPALGEKAFHPFSDFLLHNVGTGDGIVMAMPEHYGPSVYKIVWREFSID